jgi:hypothetical protein
VPVPVPDLLPPRFIPESDSVLVPVPERMFEVSPVEVPILVLLFMLVSVPVPISVPVVVVVELSVVVLLDALSLHATIPAAKANIKNTFFIQFRFLVKRRAKVVAIFWHFQTHKETFLRKI